MGKTKSQQTGLGRCIIKDRFGRGKNAKKGDSFLHTSELDDGYDWGRLNLQSVTEQSNLDDFLSTAELAGTEFTAEKLNVKFVDPKRGVCLSEYDRKLIQDTQSQHRQLLSIPRRPRWDENTTAEELNLMERDTFIEWRKGLATLQEVEHIVMTPYEKNLDFWRQLWRVIERSDVVVQIVDARNPLLFRCSDVETYVHEVDETKVNLLLVNKADYLTLEQRNHWCEYFTSQNVRVVFWSALEEANRLTEEEDRLAEEEDGLPEEEDRLSAKEEEELEKAECEDLDGEEEEVREEVKVKEEVETESDKMVDKGNLNKPCSKDCDITEDKVMKEIERELNRDESKEEVLCRPHVLDANCIEILQGHELLQVLRKLHNGKKYKEGVTTFGMIGYPNVGKSSTINAILKMKKVPVSTTPGRTKHFQTVFVDSTLMLCDCPGLVFPSFVSTKADLVINGVLPIDQLRDHLSPISLVCEHIPRASLVKMYSLHIPLPENCEISTDDLPVLPDELLNAYGLMRGYMTSNGLPDCPRSARYILKDFVTGRLLYCCPPPTVDAAIFKPTPELPRLETSELDKFQLQAKILPTTKLDRAFFAKSKQCAHTKGVNGVQGFIRTRGLQQISATGTPTTSLTSLDGKPWKKHHNRKKNEKLRRVYGHLDN